MSVNVRGVFLCLKHEIPLMLETAGSQGAIVITSSTAGMAALCTVKLSLLAKILGMRMLHKCLAYVS